MSGGLRLQAFFNSVQSLIGPFNPVAAGLGHFRTPAAAPANLFCTKIDQIGGIKAIS